MASNGIFFKAKKGTCRICQRVRCTAEQVKAVGERHHGFATGYIWECIDTGDCDKVAERKLKEPTTNGVIAARIKTAIEKGRFTEYNVYV